MASVPRNGHQFELTVLGCSGGPLDRGTCSYLLKPSGISYSEIVSDCINNKFICIDAGTGLSGLVDLITKIQTDTIMKENSLLGLYTDSLSVTDYTYCETTVPFNLNEISSSPYQLASTIMGRLQNYLITHPHADHVLGLIINSPVFSQQTINGTASTIKCLTNNIFNNRIWPALDTVTFKTLDEESTQYQITEDFEVQYFTNSHGSFVERDQRIRYESSAYLISHSVSGRQLLVFGDVEADSVSHCGKNKEIWQNVAPLIYRNELAAIVIECSNHNLPSNVPLYGHMTPVYLMAELKTLQDIISTRFGDGAKLDGLHVIITHVKESISGCDPRKRVLKELQDLNLEHKLGLVFTIALPGLTYCL